MSICLPIAYALVRLKSVNSTVNSPVISGSYRRVMVLWHDATHKVSSRECDVWTWFEWRTV